MAPLGARGVVLTRTASSEEYHVYVATAAALFLVGVFAARANSAAASTLSRPGGGNNVAVGNCTGAVGEGVGKIHRGGCDVRDKLTTSAREGSVG